MMENRKREYKVKHIGGIPGLDEVEMEVSEDGHKFVHSVTFFRVQQGTWAMLEPSLITNPSLAADLEAAYREHAKGENQCQKQS